jgi:hypothetical protein
VMILWFFRFTSQHSKDNGVYGATRSWAAKHEPTWDHTELQYSWSPALLLEFDFRFDADGELRCLDHLRGDR